MIEKSTSSLNQKRNISKEKINILSNKSFSISSFKSLNLNLSNNIQDNSKVVVRIKPNIEEDYLDDNKFYDIKDNNIIEFIGSKNNSKIFKFDYIFNEDSQQSQIFELCSKDICDSLFEGFNGTIFTYGQINSGKTYTILGQDYTDSILNNSNFVLPNQENSYMVYMKKKEEEGKGLIPRSIEYLLDKKEELCEKNKDINLNIELNCSFYEIFNDQIYDLFNNSSWINLNPLIKEKEGILKENLTKIKINDKTEAFNLIKMGNQNRQSFSLIANTQSKSHSVFSINIIISRIENENIIKSKSILNLVDLAGCESKTSTENLAEKKKDTGKINKSLLGLGNVIQNVGENFIPYRDTKLTFFLKDSLSVNPKTCFIATISSLKKNLQETLFTLNFAQNIKKIKNKNNGKNINSKKNILIEEESNQIITKEEIEKEKNIYNNLQDEIFNLINILQKLGENSQEINKFKEKFKQNSMTIKNLNENHEQSYNILLNKKKEIEELEKENEIIENRINTLSINLIIKEQIYNNIVKNCSENEKLFFDIKNKFNNIYEIYNEKYNLFKSNKDILSKQKEDFKNTINNKKQCIQENKKELSSKNNMINDLQDKFSELEKNIISNSSINSELEKEIKNLKKEIEILNTNIGKSEEELLLLNDKLIDKNIKLNEADNILNSTQKLYKNKLLNNKGDINKLNSIINQSTSNEIESKNRIFVMKNRLIEYDIFLKILKKTKEFLIKTLDALKQKFEKYKNELDDKINLYNNLVEINKDFINKIDLLNKKFQILGRNNKNNKENETKSEIIKLNEENYELSKDISLSENMLNCLHLKNSNIFKYHENIDQKINEYRKLYNTSQKDIAGIIEKNALRKSLSLIETIRNNNNIKENNKINLLTISIENAICLLKEKEDLIKNIQIQNENIRLKAISSVRENNIKTTEITLLNDIEHRSSFNFGPNNKIK